MLLWTALMAGLSVARHRAFWTGRFDLGNMVQAVWSTAHGHILQTTEVGGEQITRLGAHADPILILFAPIWRIWPSPEMLLVLQAAIVALGAIPAFSLARRRLGDDRLALAAAAVYLLLPPLQYAVLFDFHPVTLAAPLLMTCIWAADDGRLWAFCAAGGLALATQEQIGVTVALLAVWMAWRRPEVRRRALYAAGAAAAYSLVMVTVVIPAFSVSGANPHGNRFGALGSSQTEVVETLVTRPWVLAEVLASPGRLLYLPMLLAPVLFLAVLSPGLAVAALPQIALNVFAGGEPPRMVEFHYAVTLVPFLVGGMVLGLARLRSWSRPAWLTRLARRDALAAGTLVAAVLVAGIVQGPLPIWGWIPGGHAGSPHHGFTPDAEARALARAVDLVPDDVVVSASNAPGAHLSDRETVYLFPMVADAEWIVISSPGRSAEDTDLRRGTLRPDDAARAQRRIARSGVWERVYREAGVTVYRRTVPLGG